MPRRPLVLLTAFLLFMLLRQAWVAMYVHPYADDFSYAVVGMQHELLPRLAEERATWNGRWASNVLMLRGPLVLGMEHGLPLYRIVPLLLIAATVAAFAALLRQIWPGGRSLRWTWALALTVLYLHIMPHLGQGIHWYTGAITYQLGGILLILHVAALLALHRQGMSPWRVLGAVFTLMLASGFNEVNAVMLVVLHIVRWAWGGTDERGWWGKPLLLALAVAALVHLATAPGNAVRGAYFPARHDPFLTLAWSTAQTGRFLLRWVLDPAVVLGALLMVHALRQRSDLLPRPLWGPWRWTAVLVAVVFIPIALPYWSTGLLGQHRTVNLGCLLFLPVWAATIIAWDRAVFRPRGWLPPLRGVAGRRVVWGLWVVAMLFTGNDGRIHSDLLQGRLRDHDRQMLARYTLVREAGRAGVARVTVPPMHDPPRSIAPIDLFPDPQHWYNVALATHLGAPQLAIIVADQGSSTSSGTGTGAPTKSSWARRPSWPYTSSRKFSSPSASTHTVK